MYVFRSKLCWQQKISVFMKIIKPLSFVQMTFYFMLNLDIKSHLDKTEWFHDFHKYWYLFVVNTTFTYRSTCVEPYIYTYMMKSLFTSFISDNFWAPQWESNPCLLIAGTVVLPEIKLENKLFIINISKLTNIYTQ